MSETEAALVEAPAAQEKKSGPVSENYLHHFQF